jgi:hypothetical protein
MSGFVVREWREFKKNALLGFARIEMPSGMIVSDVTVLNGQTGPWPSPPSKPMVGRDGAVMKDDNGKVRYVPIIDFKSKEMRNRWSAAVIEAMRAAHPEAFE